MASLQQEKPVQESLPVANHQHDEHTSAARKHQEADAKRAVVTEKSENRLTEFHSHMSASQQYGKQSTVTGKTKEKGKKEASKELPAATHGSTHVVSLKPMKAEHKIKEEEKKKKKKEREKKKSKSKNKDSSSSSSSESEDDAPSKKKGGKEKKHK